MSKLLLIIAGLFSFLLLSCNHTVRISNGDLTISLNHKLETKIFNTAKGAEPLMKDYASAEFLVCRKFKAEDFEMKGTQTESVNDSIGKGKRIIISGDYKNGPWAIQKILEYTVYDSYPGMALLKVKYINTSDRHIEVSQWVNNHYEILSNNDSPAFWSFQSSSTGARKDWIVPVDSAYYQENFQGMNNSDYGGGTPVVDLWRKDAGIAIGHVEMKPRLVSLPVEKDQYDQYTTISISRKFQKEFDFAPGDTLSTYTTFVSVHQGDYFNSLRQYSSFMQKRGIHLAPVEPAAYEAVWCAWGYMRKVTLNEIIGTLPKVKELGLKWVDIDDGYQQAEGDWDVNRKTYPHGGADMRKLVDKIHSMGLKAKIWWAPLAVDPDSKLLKDNPDLLLESPDGAPRFISWWNSYYMSPVYSKTIEHTKGVLKMFLSDWDYDGLKMDGQHLNCVPPDYNERHHLENPVQAFEDLPLFYKMIYETARAYKPHAVLQICPCGDAMSFYIMPWMNQAVASDPTSSWQTRLKCKTYKALLNKTAFYGDHVELSDGGDDFATQIGIGAVLGTKFTWPKDNPYVTEGHFVLTPEKEKEWRKWIAIYNDKMLSRESYLGSLYDIGYDKPETHVISKADTLFYAFYAPEWKGKIELRGLGQGNYRVHDYVNNVDMGTISASSPWLPAEFKHSLLIEVYPAR